MKKINQLLLPTLFALVLASCGKSSKEDANKEINYYSFNNEKTLFLSGYLSPTRMDKKYFDWAKEVATQKKKIDCSKAVFLTIKEGLCVQMMHHGSYDDEPATVAIMDKYLEDNGYVNDFSDTRLHHEIYLSDARKVAPNKLKTVIRHPIRKK